MSVEAMASRYLTMAESRADLTSDATLPAGLPLPDVLAESSAVNACRVRRASPISACAVG